MANRLIAESDRVPPEAGDRSQRLADALVAVCTEPGTDAADQPSLPHVSVFVDVHSKTSDPTGHTTSGALVGPNTLEELFCIGTVDVTGITPTGRPIDMGRRSAKIPRRLRRFVLARDGGCCADGCTSTYRLQPHHRMHWAEGGPTDADNLVALCWYHHHVVVHQKGYRIDPRSPSRRLRFRRPPATGPPH